MDGHCATCKWWDGPPDEDLVKEDLAVADWGTCTLAAGGDGPKHPESLAWCVDAASYSAMLLTHAEFGCVQWARKD